MNKQIITIESLEQFEQQIALLSQGDIIFRGENAFYEYMNASAFRRQLESIEGETAYNWHELIKEFYSETQEELTNQEKKSFVAFSQHYGIPTNLLDVTTSPLVALYFACQPNDRLKQRQQISENRYNHLEENEKEEVDNYFSDAGFVFYFDKFIDATSLIEQLNGRNFIDHFFLGKEEYRILLLPYLQKYKDSYREDFYNLWHEFKRIAYCTITEHSNYGPLDRTLEKLFSYKEIEENYLEIFDFLRTRRQFHLLKDQIKSFDADVIAYVMAISLYIKREKTVYGDEEEFIPYFPNLLYSPPIEFQRGKNQCGKFLYQAYFNYNNSLLDFIPQMHGKDYWNSFSLQCFRPSNTVFKITNKELILESLDQKGINQKAIWCDFDNIAGYIKKRAKGTTNIGIQAKA